MSLESSIKKSKKNSIPILQYGLEGNLIKEWSSLTEAFNVLKIHNINRVLRGKQNHAGGFMWRYKKDNIIDNNVQEELYIPIKKGKKTLYYNKDKSRLKNALNSSKYVGSKIKTYYIDGTFIGEYDNPSIITFIFFDFKIHTRTILDSCEQTKNKTIQNYIFQYSNNDNIKQIIKELKNNKKLNTKKVLQYDLEGNFIKEWDNSYQIQKSLGFLSGDIRFCCEGKQKTSKGYKWEYGDSYLDNLPLLS